VGRIGSSSSSLQEEIAKSERQASVNRIELFIEMIFKNLMRN
jgi:hypothetical protein